MNILGQLKRIYTKISSNQANRDRSRKNSKPFSWAIYSILAIGVMAAFAVKGSNTAVFSQTATPNASIAAARICDRPKAGSIVADPVNLKNMDGSPLRVNLTIKQGDNNQNCYVDDNGNQAPTLRIDPGKQGDILAIGLTNKLAPNSPQVKKVDHKGIKVQNNCVGGMPFTSSTNLHFHGFNVSPVCHQDEVVKTKIEPNETFKYRVKIPDGESPGLYWYHPHVHMESEAQVLSGLTGALVVEGIGKFNEKAQQLSNYKNEKIFVLRDMNTQDSLIKDEIDNKQCLKLNNNKVDKIDLCKPPAKDISINNVPIEYLGFDKSGHRKFDPPAIIQMGANQEQFWRVVNTAADTYFDLQVKYDNKVQDLKIVGMDGVPINSELDSKGQVKEKNKTITAHHVLLVPGGRAEFLIKGPAPTVKNAQFLTKNVDRKADIDPDRTIATISTKDIKSINAKLVAPSNLENVDLTKVKGDRFSGLRQLQSNATRTIYFSQKDFDPIPPSTDPTTEFYITEDKPDNSPQVYKMDRIDIQNVKEGTTEDWTIENRAEEAHAFHIHQIHFLVMENNFDGQKKDIGMMRDTINLPAWNGKCKDGTTVPQSGQCSANNTPKYPSVKLKMDFKGIKQKGGITSIAGTFVFHCHILEHEDGGMMGNIQVKA